MVTTRRKFRLLGRSEEGAEAERAEDEGEERFGGSHEWICALIVGLEICFGNKKIKVWETGRSS